MLLRYESAKSLKRITPKKNDYMKKLIYNNKHVKKKQILIKSILY